MNKIKAIIFDFDGIIVESLNIKTEAFSEIYQSYGEHIVKKVVAHHEKNGGMSRFEKFRTYHSEFLNQSINDQQVIDLANLFSKLVLTKVINSPFVPGVYKFISTYFKTYDLFISTGTPLTEIDVIIEKRDNKLTNIIVFFMN